MMPKESFLTAKFAKKIRKKDPKKFRHQLSTHIFQNPQEHFAHAVPGQECPTYTDTGCTIDECISSRKMCLRTSGNRT
jgi:hypothetical protein